MLLSSGLAVLLHSSNMRKTNPDPGFWVSTGRFALILPGLKYIGDENRFLTLVDVLRELQGRDESWA